MAWWHGYFDESFFRLHDPLFPEEESRREAAAMLEMLGLAADAAILDVPCGWGRHTNLFPAVGHRAFGADLSTTLLRRAADGARERGLPARYAAADLRALPFRDGSFDGVVNVFTSLGLFGSDEDDRAALREARRVLRPGGVFLLESMHRDDVVCAFAEHDRWTLPDGTEVTVEREFDAVRGTSTERLQWNDGTDTGVKEHTLRLRTATEIDRLLHDAGFDRIRYYGDWDAGPFSHDSGRLIAVARRDN